VFDFTCTDRAKLGLEWKESSDEIVSTPALSTSKASNNDAACVFEDSFANVARSLDIDTPLNDQIAKGVRCCFHTHIIPTLAALCTRLKLKPLACRKQRIPRPRLIIRAPSSPARLPACPPALDHLTVAPQAASAGIPACYDLEWLGFRSLSKPAADHDAIDHSEHVTGNIIDVYDHRLTALICSRIVIASPQPHAIRAGTKTGSMK